MKIKYIVTLANKKVRIRFLAMERSLRATGCELPLLVIPYDEDRFELPKNAEWWVVPEIIEWTQKWQTHPTMRKYQCLTIDNYQFVDSDLCFIRNPEHVLEPHNGFISSCGHWHNPGNTIIDASLKYYQSETTVWQKNVFNTGQWACDSALFTISELFKRSESEEFVDTCIRYRFHEQPGVNLLVNSSNIDIKNLLMPPYNMESTWAGDYPGDYLKYWEDEKRKPYMIHWAGTKMWIYRPINEVFYSYLSPEERKEWDKSVLDSRKKHESLSRKYMSFRQAVKHFLFELCDIAK